MPVCELRGTGDGVLPGAYVIADDFTGACDTGVLFRSAGISVSVELNAAEFAHSRRPERLGNILGPVKVILTDTRTMEPDAAAAVAESMGQSIRKLGASHAYQKIDSTMRGNVGAEIEALLTGLGRTAAVLCPAFPAMGRTVRQGILFVDGKPVTQTQYARDPRNPIDADALADIVHATAPELDVVAVTRDALTAAIDSASGGHLVLVVDAVTDADLDEIAGVLAQRRDVLPVGAAGLARALAREWAADLAPAPAAEPLALSRIILASGSANPRSIEQLQLLEDIGFEIVRLDKRELTTDEGAEREGKRALEQLLRQAAYAPLVAVALTDQRVEVPPGRGPFERFVAEVVADFVAAVDADPHATAVIVAGADTCRSVCRVLDTERLVPVREILTGIPWSESDRGFHFVSKAGGFGNINALADVIEFCRSALRPENKE